MIGFQGTRAAWWEITYTIYQYVRISWIVFGIIVPLPQILHVVIILHYISSSQ